jgi:hypothetical protein
MPARSGAARLKPVGETRARLSLDAPISDLLTIDGDERTALGPDGTNAYGCKPFPEPFILDFSSSTASSISEEAMRRVGAARDLLQARSVGAGLSYAFAGAVEDARLELAIHLGLETGTDVIFAASGTDGQLTALFLTRLLLGGPVTTIIVGSDQTGSGTAFTSIGRHIGHVTAQGASVECGDTIPGLGDTQTEHISFLKNDGTFRSLGEMDEAVVKAAERAVRAGRKVLVQAMDASKFGWRAPSDDALDFIRNRWAGQVQIVVDACQMRLGRARLQDLLARGYITLVTGSKFFTGPAFSGAILVPERLGARLKHMIVQPFCLGDYSSVHDWPEAWSNMQEDLSTAPRIGQWLRWQAALEEMRLYFRIPGNVRHGIATALASTLETSIKTSTCLHLLDHEARATDVDGCQSIFAVIPGPKATPLPQEACAVAYRSLQRSKKVGAQPCRVGQPVSLPARRTAALRLSISARAIRSCWADTANGIRIKTEHQQAGIRTIVKRLECEIASCSGQKWGA